MKRFSCQACGQLVFFDNAQCLGCGSALGYLPEQEVMSALEPAGGACWRALAPEAQGTTYRQCLNYREHKVCNWMVLAEAGDDRCRACQLNQTIPDLSVAGNWPCWQRVETAKRWLVYSLLRLGLPLVSKAADPEYGLAFDFLADSDASFQETGKVMTGYVQGLITLNIAEADDAVRERARLALNEVYRTLPGHFRHEVGHYYWERLIRDSDRVEAFRGIFGDETTDYEGALKTHYENGPPPDWQSRFVSAYASAHPWEDWAETWAHYLHMVDTLETAREFHLEVSLTARPEDRKGVETPPYRPISVDAMMDEWVPLTIVINCFNRSMGQPDVYPFVLSTPAVEKLRFVHDTIHEAAG